MMDMQLVLRQHSIDVDTNHSADLLFELTMATLSSSWQSAVPFTDALSKVQLITPHSCW